MQRIAGTVSLLIAATLAASPQPSRGQDIIARIINGAPTDAFPSVGIVGSREFGEFCSGVLISPRLVLTAGHCAEEALSPTDGTFEINGETYSTAAIHIHPDFDGTVLDNDIAIYELSEDVVGVEPSPIFMDAPEVGDQLFIVGFGGGGGAVEGDDGTFGVKQVGTTTVDAVNETEVIWFFDDENESNSGFGDSGGPVFIEVEGVHFVAAIISGGTDPNAALGDVAFNTRVDAFAGWIGDIMEATSGSPPMDEPPPMVVAPPPVDDAPPPPVDEPMNEPPLVNDEGGQTFCPGGHRPWRLLPWLRWLGFLFHHVDRPSGLGIFRPPGQLRRPPGIPWRSPHRPFRFSQPPTRRS